MVSRARRVGGLIVLSGLLVPAVHAEIIHFKNGMRLRGTIMKRTSTEILVKLEFGTTTFTPEEIVSIEAEPPPSQPESPDAQPTGTMSAPSGASADPSLVRTPPKDEEPGHAGRAEGGGAADASALSSSSTALPNAMRAVAYLGVRFADNSIGVGSATIISPQGIMVTNYHVVANAVNIAALFPRDASVGRLKAPRPYEVRVLKTDPCYDLAIVSIPVKTPDYLRLAADEDIRAGQDVRAIGNPQGLAVSVSKGIVSAVRTLKDMGMGVVDVGELSIPECAHLSSREMSRTTLIQTDAAINPGNSGGPLLNHRNEIVGINTMIFTQSGGSEGLGLAVHVKHVRKFAGIYASSTPQKPQHATETQNLSEE